MFFAFAVTVWMLGNAYAGFRVLRPLSDRRVAIAGWAILVVLAALAPMAIVGDRAGGLELPPVLRWTGYLALAGCSMLVVFVAFADLTRVGFRFAESVWARRRATTVRPPESPSRRAFFNNVANMGMVGGSVGLTGLGFATVRSGPNLVEVDVPCEGLPEALDGFRIVQLSDVHVGPTIKGDYLRRAVALANEQNADLACVTGDLVDGFVDDLRDDVAPLAQLRGRHGTYYVTGNHEYYWNGQSWIDEVARLGLTVLQNAHRVIEHGGAKLVVAGVADYRAERHVPEHRSDPVAAREGAPKDAFSVLLAHQPRSAYAARDAGYDLQISGHTHGGQYFPMSVLVHLFQPYVRGLNRAGNMWVYVNQGTGYWGPPVRAGVPAEVTLLRLVRV